MKVKIGKYPKSGYRKVSVVIDNTDVWNLDDTLSRIIHPALVAIKAAKGGAPFVHNYDLPESMHTDPDTALDDSESWHPKWAWVLDEMIFAFDTVNAEDHTTRDRRENGRRLFAKYFHALWT